MSSTDVLLPEADRKHRRFAIAWRNRVRRSIHDVGVLDARSDYYRFQYLQRAPGQIEGFRPFVGFPDMARVYESTRLWPFFDLRVMDRKRPDYAQWVRWLGLPHDADRLDILSRSGGEQKGDTVSMAEAPHVAPNGYTQATFLVRGSSYAVRAYGSEPIARALETDDHLDAVGDTGNEANASALFLCHSGLPIGWVPDLMIDYTQHVLSNGGTVSVVRNNGPQAPWHMRLLVRVTGTADLRWSSFTGPQWPAMPTHEAS